MKKICIALAIVFSSLFIMPGTSNANDVYSCTFDGYEVYVDDKDIDLLGNAITVNGIKFVADGKWKASGMAVFYSRGGDYWGRMITTRGPYCSDTLVRRDKLLSGILDTVLNILNE